METRKKICEVDSFTSFRQELSSLFGFSISVPEFYGIWEDAAHGCKLYSEYRESIFCDGPIYRTTIGTEPYDIAGELSAHVVLDNTSGLKVSFQRFLDEWILRIENCQNIVIFLYVPEDDPLSNREIEALDDYLTKYEASHRIMIAVCYETEISDIRFMMYSKVNSDK